MAKGTLQMKFKLCTLRQGDYPVLCRWAQSKYENLKKQKTLWMELETCGRKGKHKSCVSRGSQREAKCTKNVIHVTGFECREPYSRTGKRTPGAKGSLD